MKRLFVIGAVIAGLVAAAPFAAQAAMDFSKMQTDELYQLKQDPENAHNMNLNAEWSKRVANMSPEQLKQYKVPYSQDDVQKMYQQRQSAPVPAQ